MSKYQPGDPVVIAYNLERNGALVAPAGSPGTVTEVAGRIRIAYTVSTSTGAVVTVAPNVLAPAPAVAAVR